VQVDERNTVAVRADLQLEEVAGWTVEAIQQRIVESGGRVSITFSLSDTHYSTSKEEIALSALKAWYIGERIAEFCVIVRHGEDEGTRGEGLFIFHADVRDAAGLAGLLAELAPAFDPDDLEAEAELGAEAEGWLETRGKVAAKFPDLEDAYRIDAEQAAECVEETDE